MYSTANCGQRVCARNDLGRPMFQSGCFLTHAFRTAVLILDFDNIHRFCIVASILCVKQILDCVHIVLTVIGYVNILFTPIVSLSPKGLGFKYVLFCCIFVYLCVFDMRHSNILINCPFPNDFETRHRPSRLTKCI